MSTLFDLFGSGVGPYYPISRKDLKRLIQLPIILDEDVQIAISVVEEWLPLEKQRLSRAAFLRRMSDETMAGKGMEGWLHDYDSNNAAAFVEAPSSPAPAGAAVAVAATTAAQSFTLAKHFQKQAWSRLAPDVRIAVLHQAEEILAQKYEARERDNHKGIAIRHYRRNLTREIWKQWHAFTLFQRRIREAREEALIRRARYGFQRWHKNIVDVKWARLKDIASKSLGNAHQKKSRLEKLHRYARHSRTIKTWEHNHEPRLLRLASGALAILRQVWKKYAQRQGFRQWFDAVWMMGAMEAAVEHERGIVMKKVLDQWRSEARRLVMEECKRRLQEETLKHVAAKMKGADEALRRHEKILAEEDEKRRCEVSEFVSCIRRR